MKIFKNDLTHYFIRPHDQLPDAYLQSCEKFFKSIKQQASSNKPQAASIKKQLHKPGQRVKNRFNRKI